MDNPASDIEILKIEEAELQRRLDELRERRANLERKSRSRGKKRGRPLREIVLDMLQESQCSLNSLLLASVIGPLHGRKVASTRFGTLSNDEAKSFDSSRARPVYLCHCLTYDKGQAVKRFWARSDWPLSERVIGPMTGRLLFLKGAAWAINLARLVDESDLQASDPDVLRYVAADQARSAGIQVKRGDFPYESWLTAIASAIDRHDPEDRELREAAAVELQQGLPERDLLFGSRVGFVSLPGSTESWRSAIDER
jgi:hypothetical protein